MSFARICVRIHGHYGAGGLSLVARMVTPQVRRGGCRGMSSPTYWRVSSPPTASKETRLDNHNEREVRREVFANPPEMIPPQLTLFAPVKSPLQRVLSSGLMRRAARGFLPHRGTSTHFSDYRVNQELIELGLALVANALCRGREEAYDARDRGPNR
jgi:hypothetical protein